MIETRHSDWLKKAYVFGSWSLRGWKLALWLAVLLTELWTTKHIFLKDQRRWLDRVAKIVLSLASTVTDFSEVKELRFLANKLSFILLVVYVSTKQLRLSLCKKLSRVNGKSYFWWPSQNRFTRGFWIYLSTFFFFQYVFLTDTICTNKCNVNNALFKEVRSG